MAMEKNKTNFDLSNLSLQELIQVYEDISSFLSFLDESVVSESEASDE
jgi:hypothetical protein